MAADETMVAKNEEDDLLRQNPQIYDDTYDYDSFLRGSEDPDEEDRSIQDEEVDYKKRINKLMRGI